MDWTDQFLHDCGKSFIKTQRGLHVYLFQAQMNTAS